ncbi:hypothetical protein BGX33_001720 [Mortierella sp. NVP41]|nr:hypothetical protein BGX33_001720 [Mortierella sp. NVP41]
MPTKLYIGERRLRSFFEEVGNIDEASVVRDSETGRSRGFGFVTYTDPSQADAAIRTFNGQELDGRVIQVNHASEHPSGGAGHGGYSSRGGGGYNNKGGYDQKRGSDEGYTNRY